MNAPQRISQLIQKGSLSLNDVSVEFAQAGVVAASNITLHISPGEFVSIVGPSGCGKTTLLNYGAGLLPPHVCKGKFLVSGKPPQAGNRDIAYMLARDALSPWRTALGNAELGCEIRGVPKDERRRRAADLLAKVGLAGFEDVYPKALSHGMRQRVALARTFAMDAPILLMDEPFGALDAQTRLSMQALLLSLWDRRRSTVLFVTHDVDEALILADVVYVMSAAPGRIIRRIDVDTPRPRAVDRLDQAFLDRRAHIIGLLRQQHVTDIT